MLAARYEVSRNIIRTYIRQLGFGNRIAMRKPYLNSTHKVARLAFADKFVHWTIEDWYKVIWSDESSFELGKNSRHIRIWCKVHEKYAKNCLAPTFKSEQTSIMVWATFTGFDKSLLVIMALGERMAKHFVQKVYEGTLSGFYFMHDEPDKLIVMEDSAPVHQSKYSKSCRQAHSMKKLVWPTNSLDLNLMENLWKIVKDLLCHHNMPKNKQEMIQLIKQVWDEVSLHQLRPLIANMSNCMQAVMTENGGSTRW